MSSGMPELGSKISLISKADIRYEGRLFTVDPQECTIALSSVRSFGTEDRETPFKIAPQSQIYDYILFRGSDIKDIRVVNNSLPHPNDPAIMQVQLPNGQHLMPNFSMGNLSNASHGAPGMSGVGNGGGAFGNPFGGMSGLGNIGGGGGSAGGSGAQSLAPGSGAPGSNAGQFMMGTNNQQHAPLLQQQQQQNKQPSQQQKQPISVLDMLADASRSTTPTSLISRKSPAGEMSIQQQQHHQQHQQHHQQQQQLHHQNQHNQNQANAGHGGNSRDAGHKRQNHQQQQQQRGNRNNNNNNGNTDYYHQQQQLQRMNNYGQYHDGRNNYNNQRNQNQNRAWTLHRGGPNNMQNNMMRSRGGGGGGGGRGRMPNQGYRPMGGVGGNQNKPRNNKNNTIKFEQDFDFEQANNKFEELRSQLSKLKVGDEPKTDQLNGETDKKDDSGNETGAGEHEHEDEEIAVGYDKTKSFFDNISCEAAQDRSKNSKTNWRQERKLNSETFGVTSTRRGSYRGRPNYYNNRNSNNYMGGGYRGYRGGNNYRNRSNNRMGGNRDGTNTSGNGAANNTNNGENAAASATAGDATANLKNQAQQPTAAGGADTPTAPTTSAKATVLQENTIQAQVVAAVAAGQ